MKNYKQRGLNKKYPLEIEAWKFEEGPVPTWLSDVAKISAIDVGHDDLQIGYRELNTGGIEILDSSGQGVLVKLESKESYVCKDISAGLGGIFSLNKKQLELLYL